MDRRSLLRFGLYAGTTGLLAPRWAAGKTPVPVLGGPMAGGLYYTKDAPGRWEKKVASHAPIIETQPGADGKLAVRVETKHANDGIKHYIVKHVLLDNDFRFMAEHLFDPMENKHPESEFALDAYQGQLYALSVCNLHDTWLSAIEI